MLIKLNTAVRKCPSIWASLTRPSSNLTNGIDGKEPGQFEDKMVSDLFENLSQTKKAKIDPEKTSVLLFPGQGSQFVGMSKSVLQYPNVKTMFEIASEILNFNLLNFCQNGPKTELDKTLHCQPAVVVTALAGIEKLNAEEPAILENCFATAGYSVGEYAALVFSGSFTFEDAMRLINVRATEMQKASDLSGGGMISVFGGAKTKFNTACKDAVDYCQDTLQLEDVVCKVSGYLAPNVRTIGGHRAALEYISSNKGKYFMSKVKILPVSGAFHTALMRPAVGKLKSLLKSIEINSPLVHVYSNIDGKPYRGPQDILNKLPYQIVQPVKWEQTIHTIFSRPERDNMPQIYEVGPGGQLGVLLKKSNGKAWNNYLNIENICNTESDEVV